MAKMQDERQVPSFLGLCTFYKFVRNFANFTIPLHRLTGKGLHFQWNQECRVALNQLKEEVTQALLLMYLDPSYPYIADCDERGWTRGSVILREQRKQVCCGLL